MPMTRGDGESDKKGAPPKDPMEGWDGRLDPDAYSEALKQQKEKERQQGERSPGGEPLPVPDEDTDALLPDDGQKQPP